MDPPTRTTAWAPFQPAYLVVGQGLGAASAFTGTVSLIQASNAVLPLIFRHPEKIDIRRVDFLSTFPLISVDMQDQDVIPNKDRP